jgi:DNA mismatch endonuclease (patch repair protein)
VEFWTAKFVGNVKRDKRNRDVLEALGWRVLVIWECEVADQAHLDALLSKLISINKV